MEFTSEDKRDLAISQVVKTSNELRHLAVLDYAKYLRGVDFIYVDNINGIDLLAPIKKCFKITKGEMASVFASDNLKVLNLDCLYRYKKSFSFNYNILLDTQIISYIEKYVKGTLDKNLFEVIKPLKKRRPIQSTVDITLYLTENCLLKESFSDKEIENIFSLFYFLNLPIMSKKKAHFEAVKQTEMIQKFYFNSSQISKLQERYYYAYCCLLKIVILHFKNYGIKQKLIELLHFQNYETCTCDYFYINVAIEFWQKNTNFTFFGKVQKGRFDIIKILKNMAWDICHLFNTYLNFTCKGVNDPDINLPLFYTIDKRLLELSKHAKLELVAADHERNQSLPVFSTNSINAILSYSEQLDLLGAEKLHYRNMHRKDVNTKLLSEKLESELINLVRID